jgi:hypothetical protein
MVEEAGRARAGAPSRTSPAASTTRCPNRASSPGMASSPATVVAIRAPVTSPAPTPPAPTPPAPTPPAPTDLAYSGTTDSSR